MKPPADPIAWFAELFREVEAAVPTDPNAATLCTVAPDLRPSARVVLIKEFGPQGFVFYTNLESRKARELLANPHAALCFYWPQISMQVRAEGPATLLAEAEADAYFATRDRTSQVGAWASRQSSPLASREELEQRVAEAEARFAGREVSRPPHWSGFRVAATRLEFWCSRPSRLHDRFAYQRSPEGWTVGRLYP